MRAKYHTILKLFQLINARDKLGNECFESRKEKRISQNTVAAKTTRE